jgi:hypothetical protein
VVSTTDDENRINFESIPDHFATQGVAMFYTGSDDSRDSPKVDGVAFSSKRETRMDQDRFESLSRAVAAGSSRRAAVGALVAGLVAGIGGQRLAAAAEVDEAGIPIVSCKVPGQLCQKDKACCSGRCKDGICTCLSKRSRCWEPAEGALCCSGRCRRGRCK